MDQTTEVAVLRDQNAIFPIGHVGDILIADAGNDLGDRHHVVPRFAQRPNDSEVAALVGQQAHYQAVRAGASSIVSCPATRSAA